MAAVAKLTTETKQQPDWSKPVQMRWWKFPKNEFVGNSATESISVRDGNSPASRIDDSYGTSGIVEVIERQPSGLVVVYIRRSPDQKHPDGEIRQLVFDVGGHGAPL